MNQLKLTQNDFSNIEFRKIYAEYVIFNSVEETLNITNIHLFETDQFNLIERIISIFANGKYIKRVYFKKTVLERINFSAAAELVLSECRVIETLFVTKPVSSISICNNTKFDNGAILTVGAAVQNLFVSSSCLSIKIQGEYNSSKEYHNSLKSLVINDGSIINEISGLYHLKNSKNCVITFSQDSKILEGAEHGYKMLRFLSDSINDTVQSHILYAKMLDNYSSKTDKDSSMLLWFEKISNNYGQSFVLPIAWMFVVNSVFLVLFMVTNTLQLDNPFDYFASVLNINPLNEFIDRKQVSEISWAVAVDSIRMLLLAALAYQTVIAARRFSFKK